MFNFLNDVGNYETRKVDRFEKGELIVDTCSVTDGEHNYETAVAHPEYNDGLWIIVQAYDSVEDAQKGHNEWVTRMTSDILPEYLRDCCNSGISKLCDLIGGEDNTLFPRTTPKDK